MRWTKRIGAGMALACLGTWLAGGLVGQDAKKLEKPETEPPRGAPAALPTYQFHPGKDEKDLFFVFDPATGRTWGYTSRDAYGFRWVDYGTPGKKPKPEGDEKK